MGLWQAGEKFRSDSLSSPAPNFGQHIDAFTNPGIKVVPKRTILNGADPKYFRQVSTYLYNIKVAHTHTLWLWVPFGSRVPSFVGIRPAAAAGICSTSVAIIRASQRRAPLSLLPWPAAFTLHIHRYILHSWYHCSAVGFLFYVHSAIELCVAKIPLTMHLPTMGGARPPATLGRCI